MNRTTQLLIGAASALAIAVLPLKLELAAYGSFEPASALAKSGNGGGHGGGKGGGHAGNGGGKGHSGEHGKSSSGGSHGKSGFGLGSKPLRTIFGQETHGAKSGKTKFARASKSTETKVVRSSIAKSSKRAMREIEVAALPDEAPIFEDKPTGQLHARLAGLNSLKRNYHAYLNSQAPRFAAIQAFVLASAELDPEELAAAQDAFDHRLAEADLEAFNGKFNYDDATLSELHNRLDHLNAYLDSVDDPAAEEERAALESFLDTQEAKDLAALEEGTNDEALRQALLDGANRNRVAQYGGDDYVNDEMMDWAKAVLGVGDQVGKIDEVRDTLQIDQQ